ncbi:MAG TPA: DUF4097 family beta strand repeat-containing protein [Blastocatellia bacterium]|nr:DUF4097 family beta strand repeat-containing protein [Blastocatellia bacterium]
MNFSHKVSRFAGTRLSNSLAFAAALLMAGSVATAQSEKRTVFTESNFNWQGNLKPGQTLEVVNRNGEIEANGSSDEGARVRGMRRDAGDDKDLFIEVVESSDGVIICAVYARDKTPGRCHHGGVSSESSTWHGHPAKLTFDVQVPRGVRFNAMTTNGGIRCRGLNSVVDATTTNGNVDVSTSEWASATTTNGGVNVSMGKASWTGELKLATTNGSVDVRLPASAEFEVSAATTNGGIHTDFPITVQGSFSSKALSGKVGSAGRYLRVATTNGGIDLRKS